MEYIGDGKLHSVRYGQRRGVSMWVWSTWKGLDRSVASTNGVFKIQEGVVSM